MSDLQKQLQGFSLTTAEILYRLPDYPAVLQSYVWQDYDQAPDFPVLGRFLEFWRDEIEGPLHSVNVMCKRLIAPADVRLVTLTKFH
ncbi:MAG: aspartate-semialdehyde dehydrogenase [Pseudomonadota bacterium]